MPSAHQSLETEYPAPVPNASDASSGDMYSGDPQRVWVREEPAGSCLAMPKSMILTYPWWSSMRFPGFRSPMANLVLVQVLQAQDAAGRCELDDVKVEAAQLTELWQ